MLYVYYNRFVNPVAASFPISVEAVLMAIVGGSGTIVGPFLGSGRRPRPAQLGVELLRAVRAVMGVVFIATVLWAPDGIVGLAGQPRARALAP